MFTKIKVLAVFVAAVSCMGVFGTLAYAADTHLGQYSMAWYESESDARRYAPSVTASAIKRKHCGKNATARIVTDEIGDCKSRSINGKTKYQCRRAYTFVCEQKD